MRIEFPGAVYHITSRGDGREDIYLDDDDRYLWLNNFGSVCKRMKWRCHTYCLMTNHYHLVIETPEPNLSAGMRQLNGVYTQSFNRRHGRMGHVFQGRYNAVLPVTMTLEKYFEMSKDKKEAMAQAYLYGRYTMKEIARHCGVHYSTVSRAVRSMKSHQNNA